MEKNPKINKRAPMFIPESRVLAKGRKQIHCISQVHFICLLYYIHHCQITPLPQFNRIFIQEIIQKD